MASVVLAGPAAAEPPALRLGTAAGVSPSAAWAHYGPGVTHTNGPLAWATVAPEIAAQARSLGAGRLSADAYAQNAYNYVRDNIAPEFRFGLGKGARGALLDQSGTPFDQAELLVALLRHGGVPADYQVGAISPSAEQFGRWTGLVTTLNAATQTFDVRAKAACRFLADGGIPALVNGSADCATLSGSVTSLQIAHVWVSAGGKLYDPSFKQGRLSPGIDIYAAMNCGTAAAPTCGSALRTSALGANAAQPHTVAGVSFVQNLNETGVSNRMAVTATALQQRISTVERFAPLEQIVGGLTRDLTFSPAAAATLPYGASAVTAWTGGIPDQYRTRVTTNACGGAVTVYADELAGRRLKLIDRFEKVGGQFSHVIRADRITIASCSSSLSTGATIQVDHPYAAHGGTYADDTVGVQLGLAPRTYVVQIGEATEGTLRAAAAMETADPSQFSGVPGNEGTCTDPTRADQRFRCRNDHAPALAANILSQQSRAIAIEEAATATAIRHHHRLGVVAQEFSAPKEEVKPFTDLISIAGSVSIDSRDAIVADEMAAFRVHAYVSSLIEGSVPQQEADTWEPLSGALDFVLSNRHGQKIFYIPAAKVAETLPTLPYQVGNAGVQELADAQYDLIIPENQVIPCFDIPDPDWGTGTSCAGRSPDLAIRGDALGLLIAETRKGGAQLDPTSPLADVTKPKAYNAVKLRGAVEVSSGAITLKPEPDLVTGVGGFPYALPFQRSYTSSETVRETSGNVFNGVTRPPAVAWHYVGPDSDQYARLGGGWVHNYQISARLQADAPKAWGSDYALEASAMIAGVYGLRDLLRNPGLEEWSTGFLAGYWMSQQLAWNSVSIRRGADVSSFQKLPDGSFNSEDGSPERLVQHGGPVLVYNGYTVKNRDYQGVTLDLIDAEGGKIEFDWAARSGRGYGPNWGPSTTAAQPNFKASRWTFPNGLVVQFNYSLRSGYTSNVQDGRAGLDRYVLTGVSNSLGRSLTFTLADSGSQAGGDVGWRISKVTDENGREVNFSLSACPAFYANNGAGSALDTSFASPTAAQAFLACDRFDVTLPEGNTFGYAYAPGADSPAVNAELRPAYRLRRTFKPGEPLAIETISYDELARVSRVVDARGAQTSYFVAGTGDELRQQGETVSPLGESTLSVFGARGRLARRVDPLGRVTTYEYDLAGRQARMVMPELNAVSWTYDARSNVLSETRHPKPGSPLSATTVRRYYWEGPNVLVCANPKICNRLESEADARGATTNITWNPSTGDVTQVLQPADTHSVRPQADYGYTAFTGGDGASFTLPTTKTQKISASSSTVTRYVYDTQNRFAPSQIIVDDAGDLKLTTTFQFNGRGDLTSADGPRAGAADTVTYLWDDNRRLVSTVSPAHLTPAGTTRSAVQYVYRADNLLQSAEKGVNPTGVENGFQPRERTSYGYDVVGNRVRETTFDGISATPVAITEMSYDLLDRVRCTAVRMSPETLPASNDACALVNLADRVTRNTYDPAGQPVKLEMGVDAATAVQRATVLFGYSDNGKRTSVIDANLNKTLLSFDGLDRLETQYFSVADRGVQQASTTDYEAYTYDENDNRLSTRRRNGRLVTHQYDALNRMREKRLQGEPTRDVFYDYDLLDRRTEARVGSPIGDGTFLTYDRAGRLVAEQTFGRTVTSVYADRVNRTDVQLSDGFAWTYAYDAAGLLRSITEAGAAGSAQLVSFTYDELGRRYDVSRGNGGFAEYRYDSVGRLRQLRQAPPPASGKPESLQTMTFNAASQVATMIQASTDFVWAGRPPTVTTEAHDGLNRLSRLMVNGGYDSNGNLTKDGTRVFAYDLENRLVHAGPDPSTTGPDISLSYDGLGRLATITSNGAPAVTTQLLYDGDRLLGEYTATGAPLRHYVHGNEMDEPLVWYEGAVKNWLHEDRQGSIVAWSNTSNGQAVSTYGPWGEPSDWGPMRFRYTGQIALQEAQLYHYKARVYDPVLGRFLQTDPIGQEDDFNLYAYVGSDPINGADPTGLAGCGASSGGGRVKLTGPECDAWMSKQRAALRDVTATRAGLAAYRADPESAAGAGFAKAATAALGKGALSEKNLAKLDKALGKLESFYRDPGTASGGKYDVYRAAGWSNGGTIINGQVAFGSGYFTSQGAYSRLSTVHEPMHLPGFGIARDMSAIFPNGALGRVAGDPYWDRWYAREHPAGAQSNVDNWACLISQQCK